MNLGVILAVIAGWYLTGLSVTVGFVVYPSFSLVGTEEWVQFHRHHSQKIAKAVGLPWLLEAVGLSVWLIEDPRSTLVMWVVSALAAIVTVVLTISVAVPAHNRISEEYASEAVHKLIRIHAIRTVAWAISALAATIALYQVLHP